MGSYLSLSSEANAGGAGGEVVGATLISLRLNTLSNSQSLGTCFGSSRWQIRQIPLPPKAHFHGVFIPLFPYDLQSQSKGEFQTVHVLLLWAAAATGTRDKGLEDLLL